jgi:hypothetical protein
MSHGPVSPISLNKPLRPEKVVGACQAFDESANLLWLRDATAAILLNGSLPAYRSADVEWGAGMKLIFASVIALAVVAVPAHAAPLDGAYRAGDFPRAGKRIGPAAEGGDARAQAYLGFMYQYGRGVAQNYALAAYWYRRSAEQGNPTAQHLLGLMFDKGLGVPTNHVAAHVWLSLAASRTKGPEHEDNVRLRDAVAAKMSFGQLYDAQQLAQTWAPKPEVIVVRTR